MVTVDPDVTPTAAEYAVNKNNSFVSRYFRAVADVDATWGSDSVTAKHIGMAITEGTAWNTNNFVRVSKEKLTGTEQFAARATFGGAAQTAAVAATTDNVFAFMIERLDNIWNVYYSATQTPNHAWTKLTQFEDTSNNMTEETTLFFVALSPGSADGETVRGDFDNFRYYISSGFLEQMYRQRTTSYSRLVGILQTVATTENLQQVAASYDLFTGTTQDVILESLVIRLPNVNVSDDVNLTSISIQTDDVTASTVISSADGAKANLTAEAQLGWVGSILIKIGTKIQLTIAGGAADAATVCDIVAQCRAVVNGGYLA